jgi:hypothetical protein
LGELYPFDPLWAACKGVPPFDPALVISVINYNKVSPNPGNFDHPFTTTLSLTTAYFDPKYQKSTKISFDKVSMNTIAWAIGLNPEPKVETKIGISSVQNYFKERKFDFAGKSTDPLMEIIL